MASTGGVTVQTIVDIDLFELPLATFFPAASLAALEDERALFDGDHIDFARGMARLAIQSRLVRIDGKTILIDACVGEDKPRPMRPDWHERSGTGFLDRLAAAGCRPENIDMVFCTHLHADHVGWNTVLKSGRWAPAFPNARYLVGAAELAAAQKVFESGGAGSHGSFGDSVLPIVEAGLYTTISPGDEIAGGARVLEMFGHTRGQVGLELAQRGGPGLVLCGDAIHSPVQVSHPEWSSFVCEDPAQAAASRGRLLERAAGTDMLILPAHLRAAPAMRVTRSRGRFTPVFCDCAGTALV